MILSVYTTLSYLFFTIVHIKTNLMSLVKLFSGAGATGHVFFLRNGKLINKGIAYSGLIGPMTTPAVVPTTPVILDFSVETRTLDKQHITVVGNVKVSLQPNQAVSKFDFTVTPNGVYINEWQKYYAPW